MVVSITDNFIWQNLDFRLQTVTPTLVSQGIRLLGGQEQVAGPKDMRYASTAIAFISIR